MKLPEDELWQLFRAAYGQYQSEILNGEKAYSRYVNDFFTYNLPAMYMSEADVRTHVMNVCSVKELLEERHDLVEAFFSKDKFEKKDYQNMHYLFNTGKKLDPDPVVLARFSDKQIRLIADFANDTSLFVTRVSENNIKNLFDCTLSMPLQATNNRHVALFFGSLREYGLLPFSWQMIVENNKLLASSKTNEPLKASQLRCGLAQARKAKLFLKAQSREKNEDVGFESSCREFIKKLKESL